MNKSSTLPLPQESTHPVAEIDPPADLDRSKVNWDNLRIFVHVAEASSIRGGAARLGIQAPTVTRRIRALEDSLGAPLLVRSPDGIHLTEFGSTIFQRARDLALAVANMERDAQSIGPEMSGRVRMSVTEGIGTFWLLPRLVDFQRRHPHLTIDAKCQMALANTLSAETDLSIQFARPAAADLMAIKLGTMHVLPFASKDYQERFGLPQSLDEFDHHKIITQPANQLDENAHLRHWGITRLDGVVSFRTDSSVALYTLVRRGGGIGALPSYASCLDRALVPIDIEGVRRKIEIWLTYHPEVKNVPRIAATIDWVREQFDKTRFPWFRDEYIPPAALAELPDTDWKINTAHYDWRRGG